MGSQSAVPQFPRGFVYADRDVSVPESFERSDFLRYLYVHPWLKVDAEAGRGRFVVVLGLCHSVIADRPGRAAYSLLSALLDSEASFFDCLSWYGGRYAVIFGNAESVRVVTDATG